MTIPTDPKAMATALSANVIATPAYKCVKGDAQCTALINSGNVDLTNPSAKNVFLYAINSIPPEDPANGIVYGGAITAPAEWILALIQDSMNAMMAKNNSPQIPITGQWDCNTQQVMPIMAAGAKGASDIVGNVADLGAAEFSYILSASDILKQLIVAANPEGFAKLFDVNSIEVAVEGYPFVGLTADPKCAGTAIVCPTGQKWDGTKCVASGVNPVSDKEPPTPAPEKKSYFWPIAGGLAVGVVVIGGGYYLVKGGKKSSDISS